MLPLAPIAQGIATAVATKAVDQTASLIGRVSKAKLAGNSIQSLADVAKPAIVEPLVLVDSTLDGQPYMTDIMKYALTTFAAYYIQAASILINVKRVETVRILDSLNPQRSLNLRRQVVDAVWSNETYENGLPSMEAFEKPIEHNLIVSIEQKDKTTDVKLAGGADDESVKRLYEVENLSVGKIVNVEFVEGKESIKIPVLIRLLPTLIKPQVLAHIFTATTKNASWKERYHLWRAGQIRLVRDLMFSVDLIDEHRKALVNDTSNVYMNIHERRRTNQAKALISDKPSMADASNIAVISKDTALQVGRELYGKIDSLSVRKKIFDSTYLILLVVVDEKWERVTIYHRGYDLPTEVSFKEIKSAEKGKGPDITEILKAYQLGSTPSF